MSVTMNPVQRTLDLSLITVSGSLETVSFHHYALFDQQWHKIVIGITNESAILYIDCKPVESIQGSFRVPLQHRAQLDSSGGQLSIAQMVHLPVTVPVRLFNTIFCLFD